MSMSGNPPPPNEPSNAEIKTLLVEHMRASNEYRERQVRDVSRLEQKLQTVIDDQVRMRTEVDRLKHDNESASRLAKSAESTANDVRAAVVQQVKNMSDAQAKRDTDA